MSRGGQMFIERYGTLRVGETEEELRQRMAAIEAIHASLDDGTATYADFERLSVLRGAPDEDDEFVDFPEPRQRRTPSRPAVRYVYFLRSLTEPPTVKIGLANDVLKRLSQHRHDLDFDVEFLGAMRWENTYPKAAIELKAVSPAGWSQGAAGTAWFAEHLIHQLFANERVQKRVRSPWGVRPEWFVPSPRLMKFIATHAVGHDALEGSRLHTLDNEWRLPDYLLPIGRKQPRVR